MNFTPQKNNRPNKRQVPFFVRLIIFKNTYKLLMGSLLTIFGLVMSLLFINSISFNSLFFHPDQKVIGAIDNTEVTNMSSDGKKIIKFSYHFNFHNQNFTSVSYSNAFNQLKSNKVWIEFEQKNPQISKIVGMDMAPFSINILFLFSPFYIIGIVYLFLTYFRYAKINHLVTYGTIVKGTVLEIIPTRLIVQNRNKHKIIFEFLTQIGTEQKATCFTFYPELLHRELEEFVLYDANNPQKAILVGVLPRKVQYFIDDYELNTTEK